ncbi:hypothetical protein Prum_035520 [Phytohabitans rumicis]|uniref:Inositol monophosphatase n=1 Tax=Phytohabitans rumicis TaxID=1076125 RepID=A0A6V8L2Y4_9ACTN|nr:hypothetical protein Prum_035520 [Phytohabitans rumicis]
MVVGEEGVAADPSILGRLHDAGPVWIVDPIDGTGNFAAGKGPFAVMAALIRDGAPVAAWILDPLTDSIAVAEAGSGAYVDGVRAAFPGNGLGTDELRGAAMTRFLPPPLRAAVRRGTPTLSEVLPGQHCAGKEYVDLVTGRQHFVLFWRTLPWDHVPGVLLAQETGGVARRLDGGAYDPTDDRRGLLVAANDAIWVQVHDALLPDGVR